MHKPHRAVAYCVSALENELSIRYHGVTSPDLCLNPGLAVEALYVYQFQMVYVPITQTSAREMRQLWGARRKLYDHCKSD